MAHSAMSLFRPSLERGMVSLNGMLNPPSGISLSSPVVPSIAPGAIPFTLIPCPANSTDKCLVIASIAALAAPA